MKFVLNPTSLFSFNHFGSLLKKVSVVNFLWFYLLIGLLSFPSCSSNKSATFSSDGKKSGYGNRFEVYYGAQTVGWCDYRVRKVEYSDSDADLEESFIEEVTFRGLRYKFKFIYFGELTELHLLRYNTTGTEFRPNDSFAIVSNGEGLSYRFFSDDGERIIRDMPIKDDEKIRAAQELFAYCTRYLNSYILFINDKKSRELRNNRVQSLGFDLLQYDRM